MDLLADVLACCHLSASGVGVRVFGGREDDAATLLVRAAGNAEERPYPTYGLDPRSHHPKPEHAALAENLAIIMKLKFFSKIAGEMVYQDGAIARIDSLSYYCEGQQHVAGCNVVP